MAKINPDKRTQDDYDWKHREVYGIGRMNQIKKDRAEEEAQWKVDESKMSKKGKWITMHGRHVFMEEGKSIEQALGHKKGIENQRKIKK